MLSFTAFKASSVERIISGNIIIDTVHTPEIIENPNPNQIEKNIIPNNP